MKRWVDYITGLFDENKVDELPNLEQTSQPNVMPEMEHTF